MEDLWHPSLKDGKPQRDTSPTHAERHVAKTPPCFADPSGAQRRGFCLRVADATERVDCAPERVDGAAKTRESRESGEVAHALSR